ncbi:MAG: bifunctional homocysteine S-methyltransferase/methylenetetrahydrofolate reductase, partial [Nitrospinae bacterium]|nr:bifunctional homocysteine S-methyltransferase/methylenetetrahydrofolate reductase [Nitrospinota bacterium]
MRPFLGAISERVVVADGAMGTYLYSKGEYITHSWEQLSLTRPDLVRAVHREYIAAGADMIETNSFGANRFRLSRYGLEQSVREINLSAARDAVYEARGGVYVAGSIGPLGVSLAPIGSVKKEDASAAFEEQASALVEGGVDAIILETFTSVEELELAVAAARKAGGGIPIIAQMSFNEDGMTAMGDPAEKVARILDSLPVDVIGANCSIGPAAMLDIAPKLLSGTRKPVSAMPNAGYPRMHEGRMIYMTTPEYLETYAKRLLRTGVRLIGGCCGTTPAHIRAVHHAVRALSPARVEIETKEVRPEEAVAPVPTAEKSAFAKKIADGKFVTCVEILPPKGSDPAKVLETAKKLREAGVDACNIPDGPRASARMSPMSLAALIRQNSGADPVLHYTCRDRNILGMQSDLLGAHAIGLRDILAVTGDPPKLGNYPDATAVYDVDAVGLVKIINNLNHGLDVAGNRIGAPTAIHVGVGVNPAAINIEEEVSRL